MKNNKNRLRDHGASQADLRKMRPKENEDVGIADSRPTGVHVSRHEKGGANK